MKYLIYFFLITLSAACSNSEPKDPWPGIETPVFRSKAVGPKVFSIASTISVNRVDKQTSLIFDISCRTKNGSVNETSSKTSLFDENNIENTIGLIQILPESVVLNTERYQMCDIKLTAINSRGSSQSTEWLDHEITNEVLPHLNLELISSDSNSLDQNFHIDYQNFDQYRFTSLTNVHQTEMICEDVRFSHRASLTPVNSFTLNDFNFSSMKQRPHQKCRVFAKSSDGSNNFFVSNIFSIKSETPRPYLIQAKVMPETDENIIYYENSDSINQQLLKLTIQNPYTFSLFFRLRQTESEEPVFIHAPEYSTMPDRGMQLQELDSTFSWELQPRQSNDIFELKPNELLSLTLSMNTSFLCRYDQIEGQPLRNSNDKYNEIGYLVLIDADSPLAVLEQLQINSDGSYSLLDYDTLRNLNNYKAYKSDLAIDSSTDPFFKFFFIRRANYPISESQRISLEDSYSLLPDLVYQWHYVEPDMFGRNTFSVENNSCIKN